MQAKQGRPAQQSKNLKLKLQEEESSIALASDIWTLSGAPAVKSFFCYNYSSWLASDFESDRILLSAPFKLEALSLMAAQKALSFFSNLGKSLRIKAPWKITGPAAGQEYLESVPDAGEYRKWGPGYDAS